MTIGGGFKAIKSVVAYTGKIGPSKLLQTVRSKNACKACAFGTGGQQGGLRNEIGRGLEICNKNIQAHLSDVRPAIPQALFREKSIAELAQLSGKQLEDLGRLDQPVYKAGGDSHYQVITYGAAIKNIVNTMQAAPADRSFFYASGRSSNEAAFLLQLLARLYGTNNVNNCSYYCHQASGVGLNTVLGTGTSTIRYDDLYKADTILVFGANPASNHPRFVKTLLHCRRRGGQVIVVNPAKEAGLVRFAAPSDLLSMLKGGEAVASHYIQPHIGGDIALMTGIAKWLLEQDKINKTFVEQYTQGYVAYQQAVEAVSWQEICDVSGVDKATIENVAAVYASSENAIFAWGMGMTHHKHGVDNIRAMAALALLRGQVGKPGSGLLPLRGHSNIQGVGSMGFTPQLKQQLYENIERQLGVELPKSAGMDTLSCIEAAAKGDIDFAWMLGGNLYASNPDAAFASQALDNIPHKLFLSSTLNTGHVNGVSGNVLILPVRVRDEEQQATTQESMFNFVRLSDGGINRFAQLKSEVEIISDIGKQLIAPDQLDFSEFARHADLRDAIAKVVPGFAAMADLDESKGEFQIEGRTYYSPTFNTDDGKAHFYFAFPTRSSQLRYQLMSVRSEGQFNSIIFHEKDVYREQHERWIVMMNVDDMEKEGLSENDLVDIQSSTGCMQSVKVRKFDVRAGNMMVYYPEANILVPRDVDHNSRTPGFKSVPVSISKCNAL